LSENKNTFALETMSELINYNKFVEALIYKFIDKSPVLDFGSGYGFFCKAMINAGYECHGFEIDKDAAHLSKDKGIKTFTSFSDIKLQYPVITSLNVLEHIKDDEETLNDLHELIKSDGLLILYLPASMKAWSQMDIDVGHFRRYSKKEINSKLENCGYNVIYSGYKDFMGWLILTVFKTLRIKPTFNKKLLIVYDRLFFPILNKLDFIGNWIIGKNILVVAKVKN
jgi:SAM-dependent methyltransferase